MFAFFPFRYNLSLVSGFFYPEGDDVPLVNPKLEDGCLPQNVHQFPFATGLQVTLGVLRHLFKCECRTDPYILYCEGDNPVEKKTKQIAVLKHTCSCFFSCLYSLTVWKRFQVRQTAGQ